MNTGKLEKIEVGPKKLDDYYQLIPQIIGEIRETARDLSGLNLVHLNATDTGGGVAETLRSQVALMRDIGLDCSWYTLPKSPSFFEVSKEIHNLLHGKNGELTNRQKNIYRSFNKMIGQSISQIVPQPQILVVHDPQPLALAGFLKLRPQTLIWRCHIDASNPNKSVWNFLSPYFNYYDSFIFSGPNVIYDKFGHKDRASLITPALDPFTLKNKFLGLTGAKKIIRDFGIDTTKPLVTQISRLDPWKDPWGVVDAFRLSKKQIPNLQLALIAQQAGDDPEGKKIYRNIKKYIARDPDIFLLVDLWNNDLAINAFQTASDVILQKSLKEGFGLTVTEAMWKKALVIAGNVGGIKLQIKNGVDGFLINSTEEMAEKIVFSLKHPELKEKFGKKAYEEVKNNFLLPNTLLKYLKLFRSLVNREPLPLTKPVGGNPFVHPS